MLLKKGDIMKNLPDCGILIKQINDCLARRANNDLRTSGGTLSQVRFMEYIWANRDRPVPFKEIEAHFEVTQPTVVGVLHRMERNGLVIIEASDVNGKAKTVRLSAKGLQFRKEAEQHKKEAERMLLAPLAKDERIILIKLLQKINNGLKDS